jgi:hypothetical protein
MNKMEHVTSSDQIKPTGMVKKKLDVDKYF